MSRNRKAGPVYDFAIWCLLAKIVAGRKVNFSMNYLEITEHCPNCGHGATCHDWKCPDCGHLLACSPTDLAQGFWHSAVIALIPGLVFAAWVICEACGFDLMARLKFFVDGTAK
jgi:hypothetical protein